MATFVTPKRATEYILYVGLVSQADPYVFQAAPTIAAGDFKVSIDGGALNNLGTLPTVTPAAGKMVKITLSIAEMTGDNITVVCSDAAGAQWADRIILLQTTARQVDDLAFPNTSGRGLDVTAAGNAGIDWANVENPGTAVDLAATQILSADAVGAVVGDVGGNVAGSVGSVVADVNADLVKINGTTVIGDGDATPWGPA